MASEYDEDRPVDESRKPGNRAEHQGRRGHRRGYDRSRSEFDYRQGDQTDGCHPEENDGDGPRYDRDQTAGWYRGRPSDKYREDGHRRDSNSPLPPRRDDRRPVYRQFYHPRARREYGDRDTGDRRDYREHENAGQGCRPSGRGREQERGGARSYSRYDQERSSVRRDDAADTPFREGGRKGDAPTNSTQDREKPGLGTSPVQKFVIHDKRQEDVPSRASQQTNTQPNPTNVLHLSNLSVYTTEEDLKDVFDEKILHIRDYTIRLAVDEGRGLCKGFCFVRFKSLEEAMHARSALEDETIKGCTMQVQYSLKNDR